MKKTVLLIVMDGWGERDSKEFNAVKLARTPNVDRLWAEFPHTLTNASGIYVGLPNGQMGNSEVGHLNLGAGRVVYQEIMRISKAIEEGTFFENAALIGAMDDAKQGGTLHLIGLVSDGGVHSHQEHLYALIEMAKQRGLKNVAVHAILDGRDTPPKSGVSYLRELQSHIDRTNLGAVATVMGRYYAMDRDKRWDRVERAYDAITSGIGKRSMDVISAVESSYEKEVPDEFVEPIVIESKNGQPVSLIEEGDSVIFFNFRADRARQLTSAITDNDFSGFARKADPNVHFVTMTQYDKRFTFPIAFGAETMSNILAEVGERAGVKNLRIAETEKYAHVTYFFNGGREKPFEGENRILIPSPKVATYDLKPEMSAPEVASTLIRELKANHYDYVVCNFANPDMVGHSGILEAAIKAVETVDECVGKVVNTLDLDRYAAIITADHGNAEQMHDGNTGGPHTAHTNNPVPCILVDKDYKGALIEDGSLRDYAPTICNYLGLPVPSEMTGRDLRAEF
ncbi:MAG: 2,3-bisphosphoglycerate-independent phosphoglycerate mutase [Candidatus Latescibacteria bacterium]|nr:2,3-bisphosphoglycerate-independent phosphoglycerate mutase [Candidatus Latescibacterota bacterium]NIM21219.1 2,3-bisphosphoglycerate-independent phosphoglycerate mutase [Candidatus Latescibacterota bacterium]NIM65473.1 2,3-bisphosphoglycerate-independent phosphoglycerate mutase [Candidatus Latescibacterota bacterium]NIO01851.1 2,3-bisphosphoglycerate-independent phosphoglycerate mutase [Candidatus Latescibacterota bacterium]NIO28501.1 2,3-bisphosphoglycerate-independent phosphoglycerate mut